MTDRITIRSPDDWHVHLRDGVMLQAVAAATARDFRRAIVMPNLKPPIRTGAEARAYRARILSAIPEGLTFEPLMTLYLTDSTQPDEVAHAFQDGSIAAVKLYPQGATTHSDSGVSDIRHVWPVLERMAKLGVPLLIHGEVTSQQVDIFDREAVFIETVLSPLLRRLPELKTVLEHVTTKEAVDYVRAQNGQVGATITPHHLVINRNAMFEGGMRPHMYCLPVAKREKHRLALIEAAISGEPMFFLGTDSAPHARKDKEAECGCAGIFNAPSAIDTYLTVFERMPSPHSEPWHVRFERFASLNGPRFYGLPPNESHVTYVRTTPPDLNEKQVRVGAEEVIVFQGGIERRWRRAV